MRIEVSLNTGARKNGAVPYSVGGYAPGRIYQSVRRAMMTTWKYDLGCFAVDPVRHGDEFAHHIERAVGLMRRVSGSDGESAVELGPPLEGPSSILELRREADGLRCVVTGEDIEKNSEQIDPWILAVAAAVEATGQSDQAFPWHAIIGTVGPDLGLDRLGQLARETRIGPVILTPGEICMRESTANQRIDQWLSLRHTFPITASGEVFTYDWRRGQEVAQSHLVRVCALLSLTTGSIWAPRTLPRVLGGPGMPLEIPAVSPTTPHAATLPPTESEPWDGAIPENAGTFNPPEWLSNSWEVLMRQPMVLQAVHSHYEAMRAMHAHPSIALMLFVATIEGAGKPLVPEEWCESHPECPHSKPYTSKRFYKALRTVFSRREADRLRRVYETRSRTGHEGSLFGTERTLGLAPMALFGLPAESTFDHAFVRPLQDASAQVVRKMLVNAVASSDRP